LEVRVATDIPVKSLQSPRPKGLEVLALHSAIALPSVVTFRESETGLTGWVLPGVHGCRQCWLEFQLPCLTNENIAGTPSPPGSLLVPILPPLLPDPSQSAHPPRPPPPHMPTFVTVPTVVYRVLPHAHPSPQQACVPRGREHMSYNPKDLDATPATRGSGILLKVLKLWGFSLMTCKKGLLHGLQS
jgi:hypothetical protein